MAPSLPGASFLAIGTSVPDSLSTVLAAQHGQGAMAVSNTLGSNIFDMLLAIGLPYLLHSLTTGEAFPISHGSLLPQVFWLVTSAVGLFGGLFLWGFKLRKRLGVIMMTCYVMFLTHMIGQELLK